MAFHVGTDPAAAASRVVPAGTTRGAPRSDDRRLLSTTKAQPGELLAYDPLSGRRSRFELRTGCRAVATRGRTTTVSCLPATYALDTWTGGRTPLPERSFEAGTQWVEVSPAVADGERPGSREFVDYRTGARTSIDVYDDRAIDLDSRPFRYVLSRRQGAGGGVGGITGTADRSFGSRFFDDAPRGRPTNDVAYARRNRPGARRLGTCDGSCDRLALTATRGAWIDAAHPRVIVATDLRGRHRRQWRTPRASVGPLAIRDRLVTAVRIGRSGAYRVYRLDR